MWQAMYDRVRPTRTKSTAPGHFTNNHPSGRDCYPGSGHDVPTPALFSVKVPSAEEALAGHAETLLTALDWYEDDRRECAKLDRNGDSPEHHAIMAEIAAAREFLLAQRR